MLSASRDLQTVSVVAFNQLIAVIQRHYISRKILFKS